MGGYEVVWHVWSRVPWEEAPSEPVAAAFHFHTERAPGSPTQGPGRGGGGAEEELWAAAVLPALHPRSHLALVTSSRQQQPQLWSACPGRNGHGDTGQGGVRAGWVLLQGQGELLCPLSPVGRHRVSPTASLLLLLTTGTPRSQPCAMAPACAAASRAGSRFSHGWELSPLPPRVVFGAGKGIGISGSCSAGLSRAAVSSSQAPLPLHPPNPPFSCWRGWLHCPHPIWSHALPIRWPVWRDSERPSRELLSQHPPPLEPYYRLP